MITDSPEKKKKLVFLLEPYVVHVPTICFWVVDLFLDINTTTFPPITVVLHHGAHFVDHVRDLEKTQHQPKPTQHQPKLTQRVDKKPSH